MTLKGIPSTNPHKLRAERVARVVKAVIRRLVEQGVLPPPQKGVVPLPAARPVQDAREQAASREPIREEPEHLAWDGTLDCRPKSVYRVFHLIEGGKDQEREPNR